MYFYCSLSLLSVILIVHFLFLNSTETKKKEKHPKESLIKLIHFTQWQTLTDIGNVQGDNSKENSCHWLLVLTYHFHMVLLQQIKNLYIKKSHSDRQYSLFHKDLIMIYIGQRFPTFFWWWPHSRNQHQSATPHRTKSHVLLWYNIIIHIYYLIWRWQLIIDNVTLSVNEFVLVRSFAWCAGHLSAQHVTTLNFGYRNEQ